LQITNTADELFGGNTGTQRTVKYGDIPKSMTMNDLEPQN